MKEKTTALSPAKRLDRLENRPRNVMLVVFALALILPHISGSYTVFLLTKVLLFAISSMAYILLAGYGGMVSFAHISFYGLSAYTLAIGTVVMRQGYWQMAALGILLSVGVSLIYAFVSIRATGRYFFQISIAFVQLIYLTAIQWADLTRGTKGVSGIPVPEIFGLKLQGRTTVFYFMLVLAVLCYLAFRRITFSPFGIALKGSRDNPAKLASMGFNVGLQRFVAIVVACAFAALAGVAGMVFYRVVAPENVGSVSAIIIVFISLIGCTKKLEGAFIGSLIYVFLQDFISSVTNRYNMVLGAFFIIVVMFFPQGFLGLDYKKLWKNLRARFTKKQPIVSEKP